MQRWTIVYDVDRGSMTNDTVTATVQSPSLLRAVRIARKQVPRMTDCIDGLRLIEASREPEEDRDTERIVRIDSDLFGWRSGVDR